MLLVCVCVCVCVCVRACVCVCACMCVHVYALRIVSMDKILHFTNTLIIFYYYFTAGHKMAALTVMFLWLSNVDFSKQDQKLMEDNCMYFTLSSIGPASASH